MNGIMYVPQAEQMQVNNVLIYSLLPEEQAT